MGLLAQTLTQERVRTCPVADLLGALDKPDATALTTALATMSAYGIVKALHDSEIRGVGIIAVKAHLAGKCACGTR